LGASLATRDRTRKFLQPELLRQRLKSRRFFGGQHSYDVVDLMAALELPERVNDNWNPAEFEELLWPVAAQPSAFPGGDNYCDVHSIMTRYR
jgi:hypothetical protein